MILRQANEPRTGFLLVLFLSCLLSPWAQGQVLSDNFSDRPVISFTTNETVLEVIGWSGGGEVTNYTTNIDIGYFGSGTFSNATIEGDEPFVPDVSSGRTLWGTWTAPSNGVVTLKFPDYSGTIFGPGSGGRGSTPLVTVYAGGAFADLSLVASNNYLACYEHYLCGCHWRERISVQFAVTAGQDYQVCVDSPILTDASMQMFEYPPVSNILGTIVWQPVFTTNVYAGTFSFDLQFIPAPANDAFTNRVRLSGSRFSTWISNLGATKEAGEPDHLGNPGGSSIWYSWTAPASGRVTLSTNEVPVYPPPSSGGGLIITTVGRGDNTTCGNLVDQTPPPVFYPVFAAYTGSMLTGLTSARVIPMSLPAFPYAVEFDVVRGRNYQIAVDGNRGTEGGFPLYLSLTLPPPNSSIGKAIRLRGVDVVATGYNAGVPAQSNLIFERLEPPIVLISNSDSGFDTDPNYFQFTDGKAAWWTWIAPVSGQVLVDLDGSDYPFPVSILEIGATDLGNRRPSRWIAEDLGSVTFNAVAGRTYKIGVADYNGRTGKIRLHLKAPYVDLPLAYTTTNAVGQTVLVYGGLSGDVAALLYSADNENWAMVRTQKVVRSLVAFPVSLTPTPDGPFYRGILFDRGR